MKASFLYEARTLTKRVAVSATKLVNDLTKLRKATEEIKIALDKTPDETAASKMYDFYCGIAHLESEIEEAHYYFKDKYEELGGTDVIPDPDNG